MKTILLLLLSITFTTSIFASAQKQEDARLCKIFKAKATAYAKNMRTDDYAIKTLTSYNKRAKLYCSNK